LITAGGTVQYPLAINFNKYYIPFELYWKADYLEKANRLSFEVTRTLSRRITVMATRIYLRLGYVGFVVDEVTLGWIFLRLLRFLLPILIPPTIADPTYS
jgi:hypothetical protein